MMEKLCSHCGKNSCFSDESYLICDHCCFEFLFETLSHLNLNSLVHPSCSEIFPSTLFDNMPPILKDLLDEAVGCRIHKFYTATILLLGKIFESEVKVYIEEKYRKDIEGANIRECLQFLEEKNDSHNHFYIIKHFRNEAIHSGLKYEEWDCDYMFEQVLYALTLLYLKPRDTSRTAFSVYEKYYPYDPEQ